MFVGAGLEEVMSETRFEVGTTWITGNYQKIIRITGTEGRFITFDTLYIHTGTPTEYKFDPESAYADSFISYDDLVTSTEL